MFFSHLLGNLKYHLAAEAHREESAACPLLSHCYLIFEQKHLCPFWWHYVSALDLPNKSRESYRMWEIGKREWILIEFVNLRAWKAQASLSSWLDYSFILMRNGVWQRIWYSLQGAKFVLCPRHDAKVLLHITWSILPGLNYCP